MKSELFPTEIRATACAIVIVMGRLIMVAIYKFFPAAVRSFGFHYVVYFFALMTAIMVIWGFLMIEDTDRLSLTEIQDMGKETEQPRIRNEEVKEDNALQLQVVNVNVNERSVRHAIPVLSEQHCYENSRP